MACQSVPTLCNMTLLFTKNKILRFLEHHVETCPLETMQAGNIAHVNVDFTERCPTFTRARNQLQSQLCNEVLEGLLSLLGASKERKNRGRNLAYLVSLSLLFNSNMKSLKTKALDHCLLDWHRPQWSKLPCQSTLKLLCHYGSNIVELDLLSFTMSSSKLFKRCLISMPQLQYLSFAVQRHLKLYRYDHVTYIGHYCWNLVYLKIKNWNTSIVGMQKLVFYDYPNNTIRNLCCETLQYLSIFKSAKRLRISERREIAEIVLVNFPALSILEDEGSSTIQVLSEKRDCLYNNISRLYFRPENFEIIDFVTVSEVCPNVTSFSFNVSDTCSSIVSHLHLFKNLNTLDVYSYSIEFEIYLLTLGWNITSLYFNGFTWETEKIVNLFLVAKSCINLEKLVLNNVRYSLDRTVYGMFFKLKTFYLFYDAQFPVRFCDYKILTLLEITPVEEIYVRGNPNAVFLPSAGLSYRRLKHFCFENIQTYFGAFDFIDGLIMKSPKLETIGSFGFTGDKQIRDALDSVKKRVKERNLCVQFLSGNKIKHPVNLFDSAPFCKFSDRIVDNTSIFSMSGF